jgi:peptidyl-prolyl cis-trans isomerase C
LKEKLMGCGSNGGSCGCTGNASQATSSEAPAVARINGVPLHAPGDRPNEQTLRQRACTELLRQQAQLSGLLGGEDRPTGDGVSSAAATAAIEALLEAELRVPTPDEAACRRHFQAHAGRYAQGQRVRARHVLFAVTPGVDVKALRERAEAVLIELRAEPSLFAERARSLSNCPSGLEGGELGWLTTDECAPEFARELFGLPDVGVLPRLVHSRFGLHIVEVLARESGQRPGFEQVRAAVAQSLHQLAFATALRQYLMQLASRAVVDGVTLESADSPLVQ